MCAENQKLIEGKHLWLYVLDVCRGVPATYSPAPGVMVDNLLGDYGHSPVDMLLGSPVAKYEWQVSFLEAGVCERQRDGFFLSFTLLYNDNAIVFYTSIA